MTEQYIHPEALPRPIDELMRDQERLGENMFKGEYWGTDSFDEDEMRNLGIRKTLEKLLKRRWGKAILSEIVSRLAWGTALLSSEEDGGVLLLEHLATERMQICGVIAQENGGALVLYPQDRNQPEQNVMLDGYVLEDILHVVQKHLGAHRWHAHNILNLINRSEHARRALWSIRDQLNDRDLLYYPNIPQTLDQDAADEELCVSYARDEFLSLPMQDQVEIIMRGKRSLIAQYVLLILAQRSGTSFRHIVHRVDDESLLKICETIYEKISIRLARSMKAFLDFETWGSQSVSFRSILHELTAPLRITNALQRTLNSPDGTSQSNGMITIS